MTANLHLPYALGNLALRLSFPFHSVENMPLLTAFGHVVHLSRTPGTAPGILWVVPVYLLSFLPSSPFLLRYQPIVCLSLKVLGLQRKEHRRVVRLSILAPPVTNPGKTPGPSGSLGPLP